MKILVFSDVHWSKKSSIVTSFGEQYTTRLEKLINGMNWINVLAVKNNCDMMICAGDFFDRTNIQDEEATALKQIHWNELPCWALCGNHESSERTLKYNLLNLFNFSLFNVVSEPVEMHFEDFQIHFIPYFSEVDKKPLVELLTNKIDGLKQIIISHNDIAGINYGNYVSTTGFSIKEIEQNCDLYLNGHLHNSEFITPKILNVGSFSGHNFTNDSNKYAYGAWILDTETLKLDFYENPFSLNFYKFEFSTAADAGRALSKIKANAVLSISCYINNVQEIKEILTKYKDKIIASKLILKYTTLDSNQTEDITSLQVDHLQKFVEFISAKLENTEIVKEELVQVCK